MASTYGDSAILPLLPSAMKGAARTWFDSMFLSVRMDMNQSLVLWCEKLTARFRKDPSIACAEADNMLHRFNGENSDVREYMTRKMELYQEAGETSEDLMVRRIHAGLDPTLKTSVHLARLGNTFDEFQAKVYNAKAGAKE